MDAPGHEQAWAAALAEEHGHQRELLATLRDELGTFARECASALTALDTFAGLAGVAGILASASSDVRHASLVLQVGRRLGIPSHDATLEKLYGTLGRGEDAPPPLVRHASELLRAKEPRSDRELLSAVVSASGSATGIESLLGPAPWTALAALQPLGRWVAQLAKIRRGEADGKELAGSAASDLSQVLEATAALGAGAATALAGEAAGLADSLRDTVEHVESAARAVRDGKLQEVLAEMRRTLEADLHKLRVVHESAHEAPAEWREARRAEHAALTQEVREKLERVERIRAVLWRILPHLQAVTRALSVVQKLQALDGRLEPQLAAGVHAATLSLHVAAGAVWDAAFGSASAAPAVATRRRPRVRARYAAVAAAALAAAIAGIVLTRGSSAPSAPPAAGGTNPTTATSAWTCDFGTHAASDRKVLVDSSNPYAVDNGGKPTPFATGGKVYCLGYLQTYHWNGGKGAPPGQIVLEQTAAPHAAGLKLERRIAVPAKGSPGTNNVQNANWYAYADSSQVFLDGAYTCSDTSPATWASNPQSKGHGFCRVEVYPAKKR